MADPVSERPVIYVVDDDATLRCSLRLLLETPERGVETFEDAQSFLDRYNGHRPGCLVLDVRLPGLSGLDLQQQLRARHISLPVIVMSGHGDVPMAVQAFKDGAMDFIEKPFTHDVLEERVERALELDVRRSANLAARKVLRERLARLTPREREVMNLVVRGRLNKQIAAELGISEKTVEIHRANMMRKTETESVADLVRSYQLAQAEDET